MSREAPVGATAAAAATAALGGAASAAPVRRRVAVLDCEDAERWRGYTEALWRAALGEEGDTWTVYQACQGQLPTPEEAAGYDVLVVGGSHYSVYEADEQPWIGALLAALRRYAANRTTRIFGCCFGCQALAAALGGEVGPNPGGGFVLTIERVVPAPAALEAFPRLAGVVREALADAARAPTPPPALASDSSSRSSHSSAAEVLGERLGASCSIATSSSSAGEGNSGGVGGGEEEEAEQGGADAVAAAAAAAGAAAGDAEDDAAAAGGAADAGGAAGAADAGGAAGAAGKAGAGSCSSGCFRLMESHGDQVLALPPGAVCLASSPSARHEAWAVPPNVLGTQFHLEFTEPLVLDKIWPRLADAGRLGGEAGAARSRAVLEAGGQHNAQMLRVIRHFLNHGIQ